jgi:hypothetical protein
MSFSTAGRFSVTVAANSPSVAQLNLGNSGRTPKTTAAIRRNPSQTAIQSSLLNRVNPFLFSGIGYTPKILAFRYLMAKDRIFGLRLMSRLLEHCQPKHFLL